MPDCVQNGDAELAALEDDIRSDLAAIGITVNTEMLEKDPFNAAMSASHHAFDLDSAMAVVPFR